MASGETRQKGRVSTRTWPLAQRSASACSARACRAASAAGFAASAAARLSAVEPVAGSAESCVPQAAAARNVETSADAVSVDLVFMTFSWAAWLPASVDPGLPARPCDRR